MYLILHYAMLAVQTFNYFQTLAGFHMERHKAYLKNRCRFCEEVKDGWKCNLSSLKYVLEEAFGDYDTENDNEETDSSVVCRKCYKIAKKWEKEYQSFQLFKRKNPSSSKEFSTNAQLPDSILSPVIHIDHGCPCENGVMDFSPDPSGSSSTSGQTATTPSTTPGRQSVRPRAEEECTPSKLSKLSPAPLESPSDKLSKQQKRRGLMAKKSIKYSFAKSIEAEAEEKKVYVASDSYEVERVCDFGVARFFLCTVCGNFPKDGKVNEKCMHFYCEACLDNFKDTIDTTKCPAASDADEEGCRFPLGKLIPFAGLLKEIHHSVRISCKNLHCDEKLMLKDLETHKSGCHKRGLYVKEGAYISDSKPLKKKACEAIAIIVDWCEKHTVTPCDLLLFALKRIIHSEAPELQDSVDDLIKNFVKVKEDVHEDLITPMIGLAIKLDSNLSYRQYVGLSSTTVFGKLPGIKRVKKAAEELDPSNVFYQVVSKSTGEVLRTHEAVTGGGYIDVDSDIGMMSFGDVNVNIHGFRTSLYDTISKLFEELYIDISEGCAKFPAALADANRHMKLFIKVGFDGTDAPTKSDKGSSRLHVSNWLRGTLCLIAVQVKLYKCWEVFLTANIS